MPDASPSGHRLREDPGMNLSAKKRSEPLAWAPAGQPFPLPRPVLNARPAGIAGHPDACLRYGPRHNTIWINQTHRLSWRVGLAQASDATRNPRYIPYQAPFLWAAFAAPTGAQNLGAEAFGELGLDRTQGNTFIRLSLYMR